MDDSEKAQDFRATATAFSQASGVLGGFCITVFVLILAPEFLKQHPMTRNWGAGLLLMASFSYIASCLLMANSLNPLFVERPKIKKQAMNNAFILLNCANILLAAGLVTILYRFSLIGGLLAALVMAAGAIWVAMLNLVMSGRRILWGRGPGATRGASQTSKPCDS